MYRKNETVAGFVPTDEEIEFTFNLFDLEQVGRISLFELRSCLFSLGINVTKAELCNLMPSMTASHDKPIESVTLPVFKQMCQNARPQINSQAYLSMAFDMLKDSKLGKISLASLKKAVYESGERILDSELLDIVNETSTAVDKTISFENFCDAMTKYL